MPFDMKTHNVRTRGGKQVLTQVNPHIRLKHGDDPPVFIQGGHFYSEDGSEFTKETLPGWVAEEVRKLTPAARKEAGMEPPTKEEVALAEAAVNEENKMQGWGQPDVPSGPTVSAAAAERAGMGGKPPSETSMEPATKAVHLQKPKAPKPGAPTPAATKPRSRRTEAVKPGANKTTPATTTPQERRDVDDEIAKALGDDDKE